MSTSDHNRPVIVLAAYLPKRENGQNSNRGYRKHHNGQAKFKSWSTEYDGGEAYASAVVERPRGNIDVIPAENIVFTDSDIASVDYDPVKYTHEELAGLGLIKE